MYRNTAPIDGAKGAGAKLVASRAFSVQILRRSAWGASTARRKRCCGPRGVRSIAAQQLVHGELPR